VEPTLSLTSLERTPIHTSFPDYSMLTPPPGSDKIRTLRNHIMTTGSEIRTYLICAARPDSHDRGLLPSNVIWIEFLGILLSKLFQGSCAR
jgi:hypothetical protein